MHTFRRFLPASVVGLALVFSGCGGSPESRRQMAVVSGSTGAAFEPKALTVNKDDNVILAVGNPTAVVHGFSVEGYGIQTEIPPGGSEVKIKATHPGTFKVYCHLHETHQIATLVVQ
ncbi:MAG TPA: cupredoxin domain-containing protein [Acidimicrobiales bacterium]|nr:cupredoxin domain-containing protein [Acidimicrobiales bacterium]